MPTPIWSPQAEPKRKYEFILRLADIPVAVIVSTNRPKMTISDAANHKFLVHTFKFPGQVTWNDITIKLVDLVDLDA